MQTDLKNIEALMEEKPEIKKLRLWLSKDASHAMELATALGYLSSTTINKWIKNNNIPHWKRNAVLDHIKGVKK